MYLGDEDEFPSSFVMESEGGDWLFNDISPKYYHSVNYPIPSEHLIYILEYLGEKDEKI